jgi:hypothetical protein
MSLPNPRVLISSLIRRVSFEPCDSNEVQVEHCELCKSWQRRLNTYRCNVRVYAGGKIVRRYFDDVPAYSVWIMGVIRQYLSVGK